MKDGSRRVALSRALKAYVAPAAAARARQEATLAMAEKRADDQAWRERERLVEQLPRRCTRVIDKRRRRAVCCEEVALGGGHRALLTLDDERGEMMCTSSLPSPARFVPSIVLVLEARWGRQ